MLKYINAKDIPGVNNFVGSFSSQETIFCEGEVGYAGEGVGMIIAGKVLSQTMTAYCRVLPTLDHHV